MGRRISLIGAVSLAVLALLCGGTALLLDKRFAVTVQLITPKAPEAVKLNRALWEKGQPVAEIYGIPTNQTVRVLFVDPARLIRPKEDPSLRLLPVNKQKGENPLQVKTVWFIATRAIAGLGAGVLICVIAFAIFRRREQLAS